VYVPGWYLTMNENEKKAFGEEFSKNFKIGDIVEWSVWDSENAKWKINYGILIEIKNEIKSGRLVSVAKVLPLHEPAIELEFFTWSLRSLSHKGAPGVNISEKSFDS